jgi:hypothetical protein
MIGKQKSSTSELKHYVRGIGEGSNMLALRRARRTRRSEGWGRDLTAHCRPSLDVSALAATEEQERGQIIERAVAAEMVSAAKPERTGRSARHASPHASLYADIPNDGLGSLMGSAQCPLWGVKRG